MNTPGSNKTNRIRTMAHILLALLALTAVNPGQTQDLVIGTAVICPGQEVLLPVTAINLTNIGAITLFIGFDTLQLEYLSVENIEPQLAGMSYNFMTNPPQLAMAWSSLTGATFLNTKLFDIRLYYLNGVAPIVFNPGCEITDINLQIIPVNYIGGGVEPANPYILLQPEDTTVTEGGTAVFTVASLNPAVARWQVSENSGGDWTDLDDGDHYSGTHTLQLTITDVPETFDQYQYKCVLTYATCHTDSEGATLRVDTLSTLDPNSVFSDFYLRNSPNPFFGNTTIEYYLPQDGHVNVGIYYLCGRKLKTLVDEKQPKGKKLVSFSGDDLIPGIYLYNVVFTAGEKRHEIWRKMVKTTH